VANIGGKKMEKISFDVNNGEKLELVQHGHDGTVIICDKSASKTKSIPAGDMVMLVNLYRYIKDNNIQNDFI
jgi:hypothetical protein